MHMAWMASTVHSTLKIGSRSASMIAEESLASLLLNMPLGSEEGIGGSDLYACVSGTLGNEREYAETKQR